jgi:uncharacterized protein
MSEKIIRDPVHDVIVFQIDQPARKMLFDLVNTREIQRLRRIRQLGLATLAYPGADHSRFSHSLGVMETARRILDRLRESHRLDEERSIACLAACLLHDVGHGPFSHLFEGITGVPHEEMGVRIILDPRGEIRQVLHDLDPRLPDRVADMIMPAGVRTCYHDLLSSPLDADRFDYLLRDNLMTGSRYGDFDLAWLITMLDIDPSTGRLAVRAKGASALEDYLQARYHMYKNVYYHRVVRGAEGMVKLAIACARRLAAQDRLPWPSRDHPLHKALAGTTLNPSEFHELDDVTLLAGFQAWSRCDDASLAGLCAGLLNRKLFKAIDLTDWDPQRALVAFEAIAGWIEKAGGEGAYDLFMDQSGQSPMETGILLKRPDGSTRDFMADSPLVRILDQQLKFRRIYVKPEYRNEIKKTFFGS